MEVLRLATAGSVDDGKSSLIGRLLYDTKSIFEDQYAAIERASAQRGTGVVELALLTDGLRAEREQNITIDVAHRYFSTPARKFIIADTPGHVQYTRNMVTGTSNADLSIVLVDATKGILPQSRRHSAISVLLRVPKLVVAVNKMDLVDFSEERFIALTEELGAAVARLGGPKPTFIPVSALLGDNVVERSERTPWYDGPTLIEYLEQVEIPHLEVGGAFRMAVQNVLRPGDGSRGLTGRIASGTVAVGDRVGIYPSNGSTTVSAIRGADGPVSIAKAGDPVSIELAENVDVSRGSLLADSETPLLTGRRIQAVVCWLGDRVLKAGEPFILLHGTRRLTAYVEQVVAAVDLEDLSQHSASELSKNDLGRIVLRTSEPVFAEPYATHRTLGAFVLVERTDYTTVAAGMIESVEDSDEVDTHRVAWIVGGDREARTRAAATRAAAWKAEGIPVLQLDEDSAATLNADAPTEEEAIRRLRAVAALFSAHGSVVATVPTAAHFRGSLGPTESLLDLDMETPGPTEQGANDR